MKRTRNGYHTTGVSMARRRVGGYTRTTSGLRSKARSAYSTAPRSGFTRVAGYYGRYGGASGEQKFHDLDIDDATVSASGTIAQASCVIIAQDTTESTRIGRKCTIKSVNWRYEVRMAAAQNQADPPNGDLVRVILYQDTQTNGAAAVVLDLLETADYQSFYNLANQGRFRILLDRTHKIEHKLAQTDGTNTGSYPIVHVPGRYSKACSVKIEYDNSASTGAITTQRTNNIGLLLISQAGVAGFFSKMRLRFVD